MKSATPNRIEQWHMHTANVCLSSPLHCMWVDRFAVGSFIEEYCNEVKIISLDDSGEFVATHKVGCVRVADCMCDTCRTRLTSRPPCYTVRPV